MTPLKIEVVHTTTIRVSAEVLHRLLLECLADDGTITPAQAKAAQPVDPFAQGMLVIVPYEART